MNILEFINKNIFGTVVPVMLVLAGIYYSVILKGFHVMKPLAIVRSMFRRGSREGSSPFRAVTLALAGTLGVGNIVGVSSAIYLGGFGSVFWMWVSALCAMLLKYAEIVLAMRHRKYSDGRPHGSAMMYINDFFSSCKLIKTGRVVSVIFAVLCIVNSLTMGSMIQVNAVSSSLESVLGFSPLLIGVFLCVLTLFIISRSSDKISHFTEVLVPIMTLGYIILSVCVIAFKCDKLDDAIMSIFKDAFSFRSALGGVGGFITSRALRFGTMRGLLSNEAGCGTAPAAHAVSNSRSAAEQGFWGIFEVFADTIVLCTLTALVLIVSYPQIEHWKDNFVMMTISAYTVVLGDLAGYFLAISVFLFAFATIICWGHYGIESVLYITGKKRSVRAFTVIYSLSVFAGSIISSSFIWEAADLAIGAMTVINVIVICLMSREVKEETDLYFGR